MPSDRERPPIGPGSRIAPALVLRGNALRLPLANESVDLIVTSPPYFALRSYRDEGEHFGGQIGSEAYPQEWLENLWAVMRECWRVLKLEGSCWVNLGDKRAGSGGHNNSNLARLHQNYGRPPTERHEQADNGHRTVGASRRNASDRYNQAAFGRPKSKMLLPHRFALGCEDGLADPEGKGWIVRQEVVWQKVNGLPESVTDRCRDSHEFIFHLTKSERYYSAVDEIREGYAPGTAQRYTAGYKTNKRTQNGQQATPSIPLGVEDLQENPLGKLPGSVWPMSSEPLLIPEWAKERYRLPDHFAAFPTELPRRIILGWSPPGICVECGEGRRPVVERSLAAESERDYGRAGRIAGHDDGKRGYFGVGGMKGSTEATILGYACACTPYTDHRGTSGGSGPTYSAAVNDGGGYPRTDYSTELWHRPKAGPWREYHLSGWTPPPSRPSVVLDPFGGTGTTAMVARALGRIGISVDLSADYCRLAKWRIFESGHGRKAEQRTWAERQGAFL